MKKDIEGEGAGRRVKAIEAGRSREAIKKHALIDVNSVAQVRRTIGQSGLDELVRSIAVEEDGELVDIDLHQDPTVGVFREEDAARYLDEINDLWNTNYKLHELRSTLIKGGICYIITIAGHRRFEALRQIAEQYDTFIEVHCVTYDGAGISFDRALEIQYNENFHERPESHEDALAISDIYRAGQKKGKYSSYADCARHLNINEERVSRARRFTSLPEKIKDLTLNGAMTYGDALLSSPLCAAIALHYLPEDVDKKEAFSKDLRENRLHFSTVEAELDEEQKTKVERDIAYYLAMMLEQKGSKKKFIRETIDHLIGSDEVISLFESLDSEESIMQAEERIRDREMRLLAVQSLRTIAVVLEYFNKRQKLGHENTNLLEKRALIGLAIKGLGFKTLKARKKAAMAAREAAQALEDEEQLA